MFAFRKGPAMRPDEQPSDAPSSSYRYWAFISYTTADRQWARWLHRNIETYGIPAQFIGHPVPVGERAPKRFFPLYHDRSEAPVSGDLRQLLDKALRESRYLIVICSPAAAKSEWVNQEIEMFCAMGRQDRIFPLVVEGKPNTGDERECFPPALRRWTPAGADLTDAADGKRNAKLRLISGMLGVSFSALEQRDVRRRRQQTWLWGSVVAAVTLVVAGLLWNASVATQTAGVAVTDRVRQAYISDMQSARRLWVEGDIAELSRVLARYEQPANGDPRGYEWHYWRHLVVQAATAAKRLPVKGAQSVTFNTSGTRIGIIHLEGGVSVWDVEQGRQLYALPTMARSVEFTKDERQVVTTPRAAFNSQTATMDPGSIQIWDATTGAPLSKIPVGPAPWTCAAVSPRGNEILINSGSSGDVQLCEFPSGALKRDYAGPPRAGPLGIIRGNQHAPVVDVVWRDDGYFFATLHEDGSVLIWGDRPNIHAGGYIYARLTPPHEGAASGFAFSPDARLFASQSCGLLDMRTNQLAGSQVKVWGITLRDESGTLGVIPCRLWKEWSPHSIKTFLPGDVSSPAMAASDATALLNQTRWLPGRFRPAFDKSGRRLFTTGERSVQVWDALSGAPLGELSRTGKPVSAVATADTTGMLASVTQEEITLMPFGVRTARLVKESTKLVYGLALSPDGTSVAAAMESNDGAGLVMGSGDVSYTRSNSHHLVLWDSQKGEKLLASETLDSTTSRPWFLAEDDTVGLGTDTWSRTNRQPAVPVFKSTPGDQRSVQPSPDGKAVVSAGNADGGGSILELLHRQTSARQVLWQSPQQEAVVFAISPDSQILAAAGSDRVVRLWKIADGSAQPSLPSQSSEVTALAWSHDGGRLAIGRMDRTIEVWNVKEQTLASRHTGHKREISDLAFFMDDRRIASSSGLVHMQSPDAGDAHVWDATSGELLIDFPSERHEIYNSLAISKDGTQIYVSTNDPRVVTTDPLAMINPQGLLLPPKMPPPPPAGRILCWEAPVLKR